MRFHRRDDKIDGYSAVCDIYGIQLLNTHELKILKRRGGRRQRVCHFFFKIRLFNRASGSEIFEFPPELFTMFYDVIVCLGAVIYLLVGYGLEDTKDGEMRIG